MREKRWIAFLAGTVLLLGSAVPSFAENADITPEVCTIADDGETVIEGVTDDVKANGALLPTALDQLLASDEDDLCSVSSAGVRDEELREETEGQIVGAAELPSAFRSGNLPEPESQGSYSTCWAFSALKNAEVNLLMNGFGAGVDFSELQLIYGVYFGKDDVYNEYSGTKWYSAPGNYPRSTAALARHYGAADEAVYPYDTAYSFTDADLTADIAVIDHVIWPGNWPKSESDWKGTAWEEKNQVIRELIYENGAVTVSYNSGNSSYNSSLNSSYTSWTSGSDKPGADHSVLLVGWDDEKETQEGTGAFLAMNSWGANWGDNGLFWISYNDASLADPAVYVMETREPGALRDDTVFCYTGTGFSQTAKSPKDTAGANVFTAEKATVLDRVGFYLPDNASYTARVLTDLADPGDPASGIEAAVISGSVVCGGFYKADIPEMAAVDAGEAFAVELRISISNRNCVLFESASTKERTTVCGRGESFYYDGTSWTDSYDGVTIGSSTYKLGNIPIYAYGISEDAMPVPGDADADGVTALADLLTSLRGSTGRAALTNYGALAADMDDDGDVDDDDAALLAEYLAEKSQ